MSRGITLTGFVICDRLFSQEQCAARAPVDLGVEGEISAGGAVKIELIPLFLPEGWIKHPWLGFLCPEHRALGTKP